MHEEPGCLVRLIVTLLFAVLGVVVTPVAVVKSILAVRSYNRIEENAQNALRAVGEFSDEKKYVGND